MKMDVRFQKKVTTELLFFAGGRETKPRIPVNFRRGPDIPALSAPVAERGN